MYLDVKCEISGLMDLVSVYIHFLALLWSNYGPTWGRNWSPLNKHIYEGWNFNSGNYLFTTDTK